jgi:hypothetical protein
MKRILLYVEGAEGNQHSVQWAADLVEFVTFEGNPAGIEIGVVADVEDCLEIGLPMLGRAFPRTVEGGERVRSAVRIYPFATLKEDQSSGTAAREALSALIDSGAIEASPSHAEGKLPNHHQVLGSAFNEKWDAVAAFGEDDALDDFIALRSKDEGIAIVRPLADSEARSRAIDLRSADDGDKEDPFGLLRIGAAAQAVAFEDLLEKLHLRGK